MMKININIAFLNDLSIVMNIKCNQTSHPKQSTIINHTTPPFLFSFGITMMTNTLSPHHLIDLKIHVYLCVCSVCILYIGIYSTPERVTFL